MSEPVVAVLCILGVLVVGEIVSISTRARVPMLLVAMLGYLILIWTGVFPKTLLQSSTLGTFGSLMVAPLIIHMGTIIPFKLIKSQVKAILIALFGMIAATILLLIFITPLFGYATAVSSAGPVTGGIIAFIITSTKLQAIGLSGLVAIPALILAIQGLIGMPLAAYFLRRYAKKVKKAIDDHTFTQVAATAESVTQTERKTWIPEKYQTSMILIFQIFLGGAIAIFLGKITGVSYSVWALLIGVVGSFFGFYQQKIMDRANSFGISMVALIFFTMASMNDVTISLFVNALPKVIVIMIVGIAGIIAGGWAASRIFKWDVNKGIAIALTALFGFPGDYFLCEEVSRSVGENKEERETIFNELLTPMLVGGFTTVTTTSILIASILVNTL
ncbi:MAG: hypothetical protein ACO1OC_11490 [Tuberibacillus sp.]